jgi:hypothetical protein
VHVIPTGSDVDLVHRVADLVGTDWG